MDPLEKHSNGFFIDMNIVGKTICLQLNSAWQVIGKKTVKDALIAMNGGLQGNSPPALALDIVYEQNADGSFDFSKTVSIIPTKWDDWVKLPIRSYDLVVHTSKLAIRVPTVLIAPNFNKVPKRVKRLTKEAIWERDGGICQYSGKKLTKGQGNLDHILPKSKGGKDSWTNIVLADKEINNKKGDKYNYEVGLKLIRQPKEPLPLPCVLIDEIRHQDWSLFVMK